MRNEKKRNEIYRNETNVNPTETKPKRNETKTKRNQNVKKQIEIKWRKMNSSSLIKCICDLLKYITYTYIYKGLPVFRSNGLCYVCSFLDIRICRCVHTFQKLLPISKKKKIRP